LQAAVVDEAKFEPSDIALVRSPTLSIGIFSDNVACVQFGDGEDAWEDDDEFDETEDAQCRNQ
jgi:hypothetical protein